MLSLWERVCIGFPYSRTLLCTTPEIWESVYLHLSSRPPPGWQWEPVVEEPSVHAQPELLLLLLGCTLGMTQWAAPAFINQFTYLYICLFVCMFVCLSVSLFVCSYFIIHLLVCSIYICLFICFFISLFIPSSLHMPVYLLLLIYLHIYWLLISLPLHTK